MDLIHEKLHRLEEIFRVMGSAAIGYSAGVDSTLMLAVAHQVLGDHAVALTAVSGTFPQRERQKATAFCHSRGIRQIEIETDPFSIPGFGENPKNRCYLCKKQIFSRFLLEANREKLSWVCEGSNVDDLKDFRPGLQAVAELGIRSPLREAMLSKGDIRQLSRLLGLPTWDKPSYACLASRFAYGETIDQEKLFMVEQAEQYLIDQGFRQVRVRLHGRLARVEVLPEAIEELVARRETIYPALTSIGFSYVTLDLGGYRIGSMNDTLKQED